MGIRFPLDITDCHGPTALAMTWKIWRKLMQLLFMGIFAAVAVGLDQLTKYLTVTNIAYTPPGTDTTITVEAIEKFLGAFGLTPAQSAALPSTQPAVPGIFHFSHYLNDGAAWSMFEGEQWFFALIFALFTVGVIWEYKKKYFAFSTFERWCIAAVYAGGLGNMIDRVRMGYVVDMIQTEFMDFPIFNVADCFITCGVIALIFHLVFFNKAFWKDEKK